MFERYTESAIRVLYFSREEARALGSPFIRSEYLLLGLIRVADSVTGQIFANAGLSIEIAKMEMPAPKPPVPLSIEIPLHQKVKRVLQHAADEADRLLHAFLLARGQLTVWMGKEFAVVDDHIGPEHLLLGLLHEEKAGAASILGRHGVTLDDVREEIGRQGHHRSLE